MAAEQKHYEIEWWDDTLHRTTAWATTPEAAVRKSINLNKADEGDTVYVRELGEQRAFTITKRSISIKLEEVEF